MRNAIASAMRQWAVGSTSGPLPAACCASTVCWSGTNAVCPSVGWAARRSVKFRNSPTFFDNKRLSRKNVELTAAGCLSDAVSWQGCSGHRWRSGSGGRRAQSASTSQFVAAAIGGAAAVEGTTQGRSRCHCKVAAAIGGAAAVGLRDAAKSSYAHHDSGGAHTIERRSGQGGSMMTEDAYTTQTRYAYSG